MAARLEQDRALLGSAARRSDRQQVVEAYLALWGAQQRLARRRADARLLEDFSDLLERQIAAGAVAAYQAGLVAAEAAAARGLAADAEAEERGAWTRLALPRRLAAVADSPARAAGLSRGCCRRRGSRTACAAAQIAAEKGAGRRPRPFRSATAS